MLNTQNALSKFVCENIWTQKKLAFFFITIMYQKLLKSCKEFVNHHKTWESTMWLWEENKCGQAVDEQEQTVDEQGQVVSSIQKQVCQIYFFHFYVHFMSLQATDPQNAYVKVFKTFFFVYTELTTTCYMFTNGTQINLFTLKPHVNKYQ